MSAESFLPMAHGDSVPRAEIPRLGITDFREAVIKAVGAGQRLAALFGRPAGDGSIEALAILADDLNGMLSAGAARIEERYTALTPGCPQAHWFERELAEQWAVTPEGHPWLKPIRFHTPYRPGDAPWSGGKAAGPMQPGVTDYFRVEGEEVHEVAVGPVHAGIIEPGHFRFQCHGEKVFHLEIELGYQHRGIERSLCGGPDKKTIHYMETLAGDTTVGHASVYCRSVEALSDTRVPARAEGIRAVAAELERIANHAGDLGAMAGDVGFLPTLSYCGRLRGDVLNLTAALCGNRFGRGLAAPGGVAWDVDDGLAGKLLAGLDEFDRDATGAVELMFNTPSVLARFENTGSVAKSLAREIGLTGPAARASGLTCDVRQEFPYGLYRFAQMPVCTWTTGDCFARAYVRWMEVRQSLKFLREQLQALPGGATREIPKPLRPGLLVVTLAEGWRGEICHLAATDENGRFAFYKIVDPSFRNWFGLACALREQQISDFPLCNKSFNLSYCGHDL
ncbi:MAG TPA: hydrogenase [Phycisphaerae bacterium]|nr:hydrogenase [Phycisphaerae bacterium]